MRIENSGRQLLTLQEMRQQAHSSQMKVLHKTVERPNKYSLFINQPELECLRFVNVSF